MSAISTVSSRRDTGPRLNRCRLLLLERRGHVLPAEPASSEGESETNRTSARKRAPPRRQERPRGTRRRRPPAAPPRPSRSARSRTGRPATGRTGPGGSGCDRVTGKRAGGDEQRRREARVASLARRPDRRRTEAGSPPWKSPSGSAMPRFSNFARKVGRSPVGSSAADDRAVARDLVDPELEQLLQRDHVRLHPLHLGDRRDAARAVLEPLEMDDARRAPTSLLADRAHRQVVARPSAPSSRPGRAHRAGCWSGSVESEPSWPVFIACSMSSASAPRTSPTMIRSGRMRRELRTRSRIGTSPSPPRFFGRASSRSTWRWLSRSSAASSIVTIRSSFGIAVESAFRSVVLPEPVPPEMRMFSWALDAALRGTRRSPG